MEAVARHAPDDVTITEALVTEYRMSQRFMQGQPDSDFREGIRAVLVDKDPSSAVWMPAALEDVSEDAVAAFFAPLEDGHVRGELQIE